MLSLILLAFQSTTHAHSIAEVRVEERTTLLEGAAFGDAGSYERIVGEVVFHFDPADPLLQQVVDLELAPLTEDGHVEAIADLMILRPLQRPENGGTAFMEVSNRGGKASLRYFCNGRGGANPITAEDFGDGLLMNRGTTLVWLGWQADVPDRPDQLRLQVPRAKNPDGTPIRGFVRADWSLHQAQTELEISHRGHIPYLPAPGTEASAVLSKRPSRDAKREVVDRESWSFDNANIRGHFDANFIYELVYTAEDPWILGLGPAAMAQFAGYLKDENACPYPVRHTIAVGISQTGRFLRHFLYQDFNNLGDGQRAFDGMFILTAGAGRGSFNHRFGQPSRDAHQNSAFFYPTDLFPFTSATQTDPITGISDGLYALGTASDTLPKVFQINTGYEYWGRAAALIHSSVDGESDIAPIANERLFHIGGAQHFPIGWPRGATRSAIQDAKDVPHFQGSPVNNLVPYRALLMALFDWVESDIAPPDSQIPTIARNTLVSLEDYALPKIRGLKKPTVAEQAYRADYGPQWKQGIVSLQPPLLGASFPILVPQVDGDGNEISGVGTLETWFAVGTFLPYQVDVLRPDGSQALTDFYGSFLPFAKDDAQAEAWGDPRAGRISTTPSLLHALIDLSLDHFLTMRWILPQDQDTQSEKIRGWAKSLRASD